MNWTRPYYGITILDPLASKVRLRERHWASVTSVTPAVHVLRLWFPDCGFKPRERRFVDVDKAREAGERYVRRNSKRL